MAHAVITVRVIKTSPIRLIITVTRCVKLRKIYILLLSITVVVWSYSYYNNNTHGLVFNPSHMGTFSARARLGSSLVRFMTLKHAIILFHIFNLVVFAYHIRIHEYLNGPIVFLCPFTFFFLWLCRIRKSSLSLSISVCT